MMRHLFAVFLALAIATMAVPQCLGIVEPCADTGAATGTAAGRA